MRPPLATKRQRPSARFVKMHRSYRIDEASRTTGACKATIRRWIKAGLPTVAGTRPTLILGEELIRFMERHAHRQRCQPAECFCFRCRAPRRPALGMADFIPMTPTGGNLRAICDACGNLMHKRINLILLEDIRRELDVTVMERQKHLEESR